MAKRYEGRAFLKPTVLRGVVAGAVALAVVVSCIFHAGWGTLSAFGVGDWYLLCPLGGLEAVLASHSVVVSALVSLVIVVGLILVFGKAFCAWVCPVNVLSRFLSGKKAKAAQKAERQRSADQALAQFEELRIGGGCAGCTGCSGVVSAVGSECGMGGAGDTAGAAGAGTAGAGALVSEGVPGSGGESRDARGGDGAGRRPSKRKVAFDGRHAVLLGALASAIVFGFPVFCLICPIGLTFGTVVSFVRLIGFNEPSWGLLLFPALIVIELVVLRRWCHTLCPVSALMSLVASFNRTLRPRADESQCLRTAGEPCAVCASVCPENLDPRSDLGTRALSECTRCGACIEACPKGALSFTKRGLLANCRERAAARGGAGRLEGATNESEAVGIEGAGREEAPSLAFDEQSWSAECD